MKLEELKVVNQNLLILEQIEELTKVKLIKAVLLQELKV